LVVIASFAVFAVDQTKAASGHQQEQLNAEVSTSGGATGSSVGTSGVLPRGGGSVQRESPVHEAIDEAASSLTAPFSGLVSGSSEWAIRTAKLIAALLVYGFGLGYLARALRVHA
jgi:hypothetical protein